MLKNKKYIFSLTISTVFALFVPYITGNDFFISKLVFAFLTAILFANSVYYALTGRQLFGERKEEKAFPIQALIVIGAALLLVYAPLCTRGYFFHDDYLNFEDSNNTSFYKYTMRQGRQITGIFTDMLDFVSVSNSWILRVVSVSFLIIYAMALAQQVYALKRSAKLSIFIAIAFGVLTPTINVVAYGCMFCYPLAFLFATMAVCIFYEAFYQRRCFVRTSNIILGIIYIIIANFIYQASATVAFTIILLILLYDRKKRNSLFPAWASIWFIVATGIYYILVRSLSLTVQSGLMGRAAIVSSVEEIIYKIDWFCSTVFVENLKQIILSFSGSDVFYDPWMHYILAFKDRTFELVSLAICCVLIFLGIIRLIKKSGVLAGIQAIVILPLSYYVFLILKESRYETYYCVALTGVIFLLAIEGCVFIIDLLRCQKSISSVKQIISVMALLVMMWNSGRYIRDFWVRYNDYAYTNLKQQIMVGYDGQERIHVVGCLFPGEADVYASSAAQFACKELGIDPSSISISASSNPHYIDNLSIEVYMSMLTQLGEDDKEFLETCYTVDYNFSICTLNYQNLDEQAYSRLATIFKTTGVIPEPCEEVLLIDLTTLNKILTIDV